MPVALTCCSVVANEEFVYVIGGDVNGDAVNTVYRLCLKTEKWTTMAPMGTARSLFAAQLKDKYIYVFGGVSKTRMLSSTERYSIDNNTWEDLPDMPKGPHFGHCAISTTGSEVYIVGGARLFGPTYSVDVFDTGPSQSWKNPTYLRDMPEVRCAAAAVLVKKKYLVVIGGRDIDGVTASCLTYDIWCNCWSSTPVSIDMIEARCCGSAVVLDGKIVVAGGWGRDRDPLVSVECIDADALLEHAPLHYPLPTLLFNRILEIGKFEREQTS